MTNKSNTITIKFFASIREKINNDSVTLSMLPGTSIQDIIFRISEEFGIEKLVLKSCLYALNGEYVDITEKIKNGDEIAVIPPVSGGLETNGIIAKISTSILYDDEAMRFVSSNQDGAVLLFKGLTRNINNGRDVSKLEYEAYSPMAEQKMIEILTEAKKRWDISKCYVIHRVGSLQIGDVSMILCISSKHREDAFQASQFFIDKLKKTVPIWKKEFYTDGYEWLGYSPG